MKKLLSILLLLTFIISFGQDNSQQWRSFFSYNNTVDITQSQSKVYAASENAMFSKNLLTNELRTITSVDGLKAETITAIHHSAAFNKTLVGNNNGLLLIVNADNSILSKIDVVQEATIPSNRKKINDIYEFEGKAYLSCDFGIVVFDLATLQFGDTYYMGPNGSEIPVLQCAVLNGSIYAATGNNGIRSGQLDNPNLNDYNQWTERFSGQWSGIVSFNGFLFASNNTGTLYRLQNNSTVVFSTFPSPIHHLHTANNYMMATSDHRVAVYNNFFIPAAQYDLESLTFTCATVVSDRLYIGTRTKGVFSTTLTNPNYDENITPNGPIISRIFALQKTRNSLWAVHGDYSYIYNPDPLDFYGISKFTQNGWIEIPYAEVNAPSLSDIIVNPGNEDVVYASSFHGGLLKVEDDEPVILYNQTNTDGGLESLNDPAFPGYISVRINSLAYDNSGNLWMTNSRIEDPIRVLRADGDWDSYTLDGIVEEPTDNDYGQMIIDRNNTKWISTRLYGVIAFNEQLNKYIVIDEEDGLPFYDVRSVVIDNNNRLWIGTTRGLRIISSVDRFTTETELTASPIIIMEDGLAQELMYEQTIIDIVVDGANNKWIATSSAGAFLVSPDGQRTLFHFTKENSPLPSNTINDIEIDAATGEVFFATDKGMVSYKGTSTAAADDLSKVYVFPNPVRPGFEGNVNISGLIDDANIKITDIEGNLVFETTSEGGTVLWDTKAFGKYKVASGVYMIFIASEDGTQTKVKKVMIVR